MTEENKDLILLILDMQGIEERLREFERKYRQQTGPVLAGLNDMPSLLDMSSHLGSSAVASQRLDWVSILRICSSHYARSSGNASLADELLLSPSGLAARCRMGSWQ